MDMQGTPIGSTNKGMKNTTDPEASNPTREGAGAVAADSLAAESTRSGGGFSENRNSEPSAVEGSKSTFANEDTSGATTLPPTESASERKDETPASDSGPGGAKYAEGLGGQPKFPGTTSPEGYVGGSTRAKQESAQGSGSHKMGADASASAGSGADTSGAGSSGATGSSADTTSGAETETGTSGAGVAPTYVTSQYVDPGKAKGKNLTEGGFDTDDSNNASGNFTADPGSEHDPGRASVQKFENTQSATVGGGPRQGEVTGEGQYVALGGDESLE